MSGTSTILRQVEAGLPVELRSRYFGDSPRAGVHLAIMREPYLSYLLGGSKTIESRFSVNRVDPFDRVSAGDLVVLKAGDVVGAFVVGSVESRRLEHGEMSEIRRGLNSQIMATPEFWDIKSDARFATLIGVDDIYTFPSFSVDKRDMRGWVVLRQSQDELALIW
jgi:hypothetical protein